MIELKNLNIKKEKHEPNKQKPIIQLKNIEVQKQNRDNQDAVWFNFAKIGLIGTKPENIEALNSINYQNVNGYWKDEPCYIIAAGKSGAPLWNQITYDWFKGKHTIGINHKIDEWQGFEWFLFLDKAKHPYDLDNFEGRVFAHNTAGYSKGLGECLFFSNEKEPSTRIEDGLFNHCLSGLSALNLAIISGANPIYLIGYGNGEEATANNYHDRRDYPGERKNETVFTKFKNVNKYFTKFLPWKEKIIHITNGKDIPQFKKMKIDDFVRQNQIKHRPIPNVIHLSFSDDINRQNELTRAIIKQGYGKHVLCDINKPIESADLYILHHFLSTNRQALNFSYKAKCIDIVHTAGCTPKGNFKFNVVLTKTWHNLLSKQAINSEIARPGINLEHYKNIWPDYDNLTFGRATQWSAGKINENWNKIANEILEELPESKCLIYTHFESKTRDILQHNRMIFDESMTIDKEDKSYYFKKLGIYVHTNGTFKDTLSLACIEAMAIGLPIIYLKEPALEEVIGNSGIACNSMMEVKVWIIKLLKDKKLRIEYSKKSKTQSLKYNVQNWIKDIDELIKEACR